MFVLRMGGRVMEAVAFFWEQAGGMLRRLSLSGVGGNIAAWIIFILAGGSPLILWAVLGLRKRAGKSDLLLLPISAVLTAGLWFMVNPSYMARYLFHGMEDVGAYIFPGVICSLVLAWGVMRFLRIYEGLDRQKFIRCLEVLLGIYGAVTAIALCRGWWTELAEGWTSLRQGNTWAGGEGLLPGMASDMAPDRGSLPVSSFFLILQVTAQKLPGFLEMILFVLVICLLYSSEKEHFGQGSLIWVERLKRWSGRFLGIILLSNAGVNLLQLLFAGYILQGNYRVFLPLWEVAAVLGILLLSRFYLESKRLKEENDGFI